MRTARLFICFLICAIGLAAVSAEPGLCGDPPEYALLIDVSGSMKKSVAIEASQASIFSYVQGVIDDFLRQCKPRTRIAIYTFDAGLRSEARFVITSEDERARARNYVSALSSEGQQTYVYRSVSAVATRHADGDTPLLLYVYTDGIDNSGDDVSSTIAELWSQLGTRGYCVYFTTIGSKSMSKAEQERLTADSLRLTRDANVIFSTPGTGIASIMTLSPRLTVLNLGNLRTDTLLTTLETWDIEGLEKFPDGYSVNIEAHFPEFRSSGVDITMQPEVFHPQTSHHTEGLELRANLTNSKLLTQEGVYRGWLRFVGSDERVMIWPDSVEAVIVNESPRTVSVTLSSAQALALGEIDPYRTDGSSPVLGKLKFRFSPTAMTRGGTLQLSCDPAVNGEPTPEGESQFLLNGLPRRTLSVSPPLDSVTIGVQAAKGCSSGEHRFVLTLSSKDLQILSDEAQPMSDGSGFVLAGSYSVVSAPWPWWVKALIWLGLLLLLAVIGLVLAAMLTGRTIGSVAEGVATFTGLRTVKLPHATLSVRQPRASSSQELEIGGRPRVVVGSGGDFLPEAVEGKVVLEPHVNSGRKGIRARVERGEVFLKRRTERDRFVLVENRLGDGDELSIGQYVIQISSYDLGEV